MGDAVQFDHTFRQQKKGKKESKERGKLKGGVVNFHHTFYVLKGGGGS
jgi:hypothetical protein